MNILLRAACIMGVAVECCVGFDVPASKAADTPSVGEILKMEKAILEDRRKIKSGEIHYSQKLTVFRQAPRQEGLVEHGVIAFRGDCIRIDIQQGRHRSQEVCTPTTLIYNSSDGSMVEVKSIRGFYRHGDESKTPVQGIKPPGFPYPPYLGFAVWFFSSMNSKGYEEVLLNPSRKEFAAEWMDGENGRLLKVGFKMRSNSGKVASGEYIVSESVGNMPTYIARRFGEGGGEYVRSVRVKYHRYDETWFPKEVMFQIKKGGQVTTEEVVRIQKAEFNTAIADEKFTLAGLGLRKGRHVLFHGERGTWDGTKVVRGQRDASRGEDQSSVRSRWLRNGFIVGSVVFGVLSILLWRAGRASGSARHIVNCGERG